MKPTTLEAQNRQQQGLPSPFARSVPGQSLTDSPGKYPWEKPPQEVSVEQALSKIMAAINQPDNIYNLISMIDAGISVESIVRTVTFNGFVEGKWSPDVAELLNPILLLEVLAIANNAGVDEIRILNRYEDNRVKPEKTLEIMKALNPRKYERKKNEALQELKTLEEVETLPVEEESFMAILEPARPREEIPMDYDMPVTSFMDRPPEEPMEEMPLENLEDTLPQNEEELV